MIKKILLILPIFAYSCSNEVQPLGNESNNNVSVNNINSNSVNAQKLTFPETWEGNWKGSCNSFSTKDKSNSFNMNLIVKKIEKNANKWLWQIEYKSTEINQIRKYELNVIDSNKGHFVIDEKNGIILDSFMYKNNTFINKFSVSSSDITVKYKLIDKNNLSVELMTFSDKSIRKTVSGENIVNSYQLFNYQDCELKK